jgi:hypothetical protein
MALFSKDFLKVVGHFLKDILCREVGLNFEIHWCEILTLFDLFGDFLPKGKS